MSYFLTIISAFLFTELAGYFLHKLLHSEKVPYLSRNHMIHHLKIYGPKVGLRFGDEYHYSTEGRAGVAGIGFEWLGPVGGILAVMMVIFYLLQISILNQILFVGCALGWGYFLFAYMHDAMHVKHFWIESFFPLKKWFMKIRKLHDFHHLQISDEGRMTKNFGICFFFYDRLFGTLSNHHRPFNEKGYEAAKERYAFIFKS